MSKYLLLSLTVLLFSFTASAQPTDIVQPDSIIYPVHKANVGKIAFMGKAVAMEEMKQSDFLDSFELKEKSDFNIRVFMGNSLTNILHQLSPELSADELTRNGNYRFTFYVDEKSVYTENLTPGAGSAESKNKRTVFRVPLMSSTNEDSWGRFVWMRFYANGGQDALTPGEHRMKIEIRPYLKTSELITGGIIAEGEIRIIVPEIKIDENLVRIQKIEPVTGWEISGDTLHTNLLEAMNRKIVSGIFKDITSIVVIRNGKLLIEEYFNGAGRNTLHDTRSVGKSFASAITGIAVKDGFIRSEKQMLQEFYDLHSYQNYSPAKDSITLESLLTMSSVFDGSDQDQESPGNEEKMYPTDNWVKFALDLPADQNKVNHQRWDYFTAGVVVIGDILNKSVPGGLERYADKKLFGPLGIRNYEWQYTPQHVANTAGGLRMSSLDYARFGQLYKDEGSLNGREIIPREWVKKSLSRQIMIGEGEYYGFLFWNKTYQVNNRAYEVFYSSGNGGNKIFIFKDQPLVIVITSTAYNTAYGHAQVDRMVREYLIPGIGL